MAARTNADTFIIARTDARAVHGLDDALRRAESYLRAGADGIFVEAPQSLEELAHIGRSFDVPQLANMLEDGDTPMLSPAELAELGFAIVAYPTSLIFRIAHGMQERRLRRYRARRRFFGSISPPNTLRGEDTTGALGQLDRLAYLTYIVLIRLNISGDSYA